MKLFSVIVTAGGIGSRMGAEVPKQFLEIGGLPVLFHTLKGFHDFDPDAELLVTLPVEWQPYYKELRAKHGFSVPHRIVDGGLHRYDSVRNAVLIASGQFIAIHDGVRPFVSKETLQRCWSAVQTKNAVIPVLDVKESIRRMEIGSSIAVDRSLYKLVQTPQCFSKNTLKRAYEFPFDSSITDDASLVEKTGVEIHLVEGNEENIKITTPIDLVLAEQIAKKNEIPNPNK